MSKPQFFIPNVTYWWWERLTPTYIEVMRRRALESFAETENALAQLDEEVVNIEQEIKAKWATGSATVMRAFVSRLKDIQSERKRINGVRFRLRGVLDRMNAELDKNKEVV